MADESRAEELPTLTIEAILAAPDIQVVPVAVPEWGGRVFVRTLEAGQFDDIVARATVRNPRTGEEREDKDKLESLLICTCIVDAAGAPIIRPEHLPALKKKSARAVARLKKAAERAIGLGETAAAAAAKSA